VRHWPLLERGTFTNGHAAFAKLPFFPASVALQIVAARSKQMVRALLILDHLLALSTSSLAPEICQQPSAQIPRDFKVHDLRGCHPTVKRLHLNMYSEPHQQLFNFYFALYVKLLLKFLFKEALKLTRV
jgi:hypothetical protein